MKKIMYSIRDGKAAAYLSPFFACNNAVACRLVAASMVDGDSILAAAPADFDLYSVGEFDSESGQLLAHDAPVFVESIINIANTLKKEKIINEEVQKCL